ncbi:MAG: nucleoside phosphorylase [Oscillospiraceae bacterium]|jgi:uridine phosphorylase|nr:nucleoside phosphorylase [Oscillospiraceae bacterium]
MSIINAYDDSTEEILKPSHLTQPIPGFPEIAVAAFQQGAVDALISSGQTEIIGELRAGCRIPIYKTRRDGTGGARGIAVYRTPLGGSVAAAMMEEVIVKGARKLIFFGSCGVLDGALAAGRVIVPSEAYRDEGTSYHYAPDGDWIEVETHGRLEEILADIGVNYVSGRVWTTDALYRETRGNVQKRKDAGCIAVDMECASIAAVSRFRGAPAYQFLYAEDSLDGQDWDRRTMDNVAPDAHERYMNLALEIAARV